MSKAKELAERLLWFSENGDHPGRALRGDLSEASSLLLSQENRIAELEKAVEEFMSCARCDPRMDGREVFSYMDASKFGRIWTKWSARSALTPSSPGEGN